MLVDYRAGVDRHDEQRIHALPISVRLHGRRNGRSGQTESIFRTLREPGTAAPPLVDILAIDQSLDRLAAEDPDLVRLIEMRFFAGMTAEETPEVVGQSVHVVRHNLRYGLARLRQQMEPNLTNN